MTATTRDGHKSSKDKEQFDHMVAYPVSKSAQVMFTLYLNDKLKSINSNVEVLAAHPGIVDTDIFNETTVRKFKLQFRKADTLKSRSTIVVTFSPRIIDSCLPPDNLPVGAPADSSSVPYCVLCVVVIYLVLKYCCWISFRNSRNVCCEEVLDEAKTMSTSTYFQKWFNYFTCYCLGPCYAILDIVINYWNNTTFELDDRKGQVAVMSGGHRGIGAFVTRDLLKTDMHVILGCRRIEDGRRFVSSLRERGVTGGKVTILSLDLASLESVRNFAEAVLRETSVINYLINNAGIITSEFKETKDKFESHWQVNYLGHFLLSHLLLPTLRSSPGHPKIVNVSSVAHNTVWSIPYQTLNDKEQFDHMVAYPVSKSAQVMFTLYLNDKLKSISSNVEVLAAHPGIVDTDIFSETTVRKYFSIISRLFFKTTEQGAKPIVYAILYGKGGEYIGNCAPQSPSSTSRDSSQQLQLFDHSKNSLGISLFGNIF
ncbi:retinol dehydrogenase 14-like [Homalodisca vitripennis]|uniref:retinol dehydrogenase 14-like n=1 Tax=Homalodisca vitripennis TaxID=197043 RepID=UPI001EEA63F7|nr:retinol dehydrogenase 14-like [Homalodisca vitripennis]